jgi:hypothetical protein
VTHPPALIRVIKDRTGIQFPPTHMNGFSTEKKRKNQLSNEWSQFQVDIRVDINPIHGINKYMGEYTD